MKSFLLIESLPFLLQGLVATLQIASLSLFLAFLGGFAVGVLNSKKIEGGFLSRLLFGAVWAIKGTPLFVQVLLIYYALPEVIGISLSPFTAGIIALGIHSMAYISEIVRGGMDAIPEGQWEAAYVTGLKPWETLQEIILPQVFKITFPSLTNEITALIKETSILMTIGVAELTKVSKDIVARELDPLTIYLTTAVFYLVLTSGISFFAEKIQRGITYDYR